VEVCSKEKKKKQKRNNNKVLIGAECWQFTHHAKTNQGDKLRQLSKLAADG